MNTAARIRAAVCGALFAITIALSSSLTAQDDASGGKDDASGGKDNASGGKADARSNSSEPATEVGERGIRVPRNASADELMAFIAETKRQDDRSMKNLLKVAKAVVRAAEQVREHPDASIEQETAAIQEELAALRFAGRFDDEYEDTLDTVLDELRRDDRPEIKRLITLYDLRGRRITLRFLPPQKMRETFRQYKRVTKNTSLDADLATLGMSLARSISHVGQNELAADFYEYLANRMANSEDASLRDDASKFDGVVRRLRLPGKELELSGTTAQGEAFDWQAYRGKWVLVDFWASWCGPCVAEIPNMKRNLKGYRRDQFDIVGINLDNSVEACREFVQENDLSWVNLVGRSESEMGWDHPLAMKYGVMAIPTAILVDEKGVVVSLQARGEELNRLLRERLGEPEPQSRSGASLETEGPSQAGDQPADTAKE